MVSFGANVFKFVIKTGKSVTEYITGKSLMENMKNAEQEKPSNHKFNEGYNVTFKETENKSRYIILQKKSNEPIRKIIYLIHGGAYHGGLSSIYYNFSYTLCNLKDDLAVVLLDYSLAPEFKYPTQINEAYDVWNDLTTQYKPEDILVMGDSSGGNCSLVLIQRLVKENKELPKAAVIISAMADYTMSGKSMYTNYQKDFFFGKNEPLTEEALEEFKKAPVNTDYYGDNDPKDTTISPVLWDYTAFPKKSLFFVGGDEVFLSDTLTIVEKLKNNGIETECVIGEGMYHCYVIGTTWIPEINEAQTKLKSFILENLY